MSTRPAFRIAIALSVALAALGASPAQPTCGLTIITHGYQNPGGSGALPAWVREMAQEITNRIAAAIPIYRVRYDKDTDTVLLQDGAGSINVTETGGAIVLLDWVAVANETLDYPAQFVADRFFVYLFGQTHSGRYLVELPIHLIGHSRGTSLNTRIAAALAGNGVLVEQVTTLDPHPVRPGDIPGGTDVIPTTYINTVFADNYYRTGAFPAGRQVTGAANDDLSNTIDGDDCSEHTSVHTYYFGTVDLDALADVDGCDVQDIWYLQSLPRGETGYNFSRYSDIRVARPADGINQFLVGAGGTGTRDPLDSPNQLWPNVGVDQRSSLPSRVLPGQGVAIPYYFNDRNTEQMVILSLDNDTNPYNNQGNPGFRQIGSSTHSSRPGGSIGSATFSWIPTMADAGNHFIQVCTTNTRTDSVRVRYDYFFRQITVEAVPTSPDLTVLAVTGPSTATVGASISVNFTARNTGTAPSGAFANRVSLATTPYGTQFRLANFPMASLTTSGQRTETRTIPIPIETQPGTYYLTVFADAFGEVNESDENNNIGSTTPNRITVSVPTYNILTSASPAAGGTTSGGGTYSAGTTVNVVAAPNANYSFVNWTEGGTPVSSSASYLFTVTANRTLVANFTTAAIAPTITSQPQDQIASIGGSATFTVAATGTQPLSYQWRKNAVNIPGQTGSTFTLNNVSSGDAGPYNVRVSNAAGSVVSDVATLTVNVGGALRISQGIQFVEPPPYYVNGAATADAIIQNVSGTSVSLDRIQVDSSFHDNSGGGPYTRNWPAENFSPPLVLAPNGTYRYTRNNSSDVFPGLPTIGTARVYVKLAGVPGLQLVSDAAPGASAVLGFDVIAPTVFSVSASVAPASGGTVTGAGSYTNGTMATLTAVANSGFSFINWTENGNPLSGSPTLSFTVTTNRTLQANFMFIAPTYTLTVSGLNGSVARNPDQQSYVSGSQVLMAASPDMGYQFDHWSGDASGTNNPLTVVMNGNKTITAHFVPFISSEPPPDFLWAKQSTGTGAARCQATTIDEAGNTIVTGLIFEDAVIGGILLTNAGGEDIFVAKYDYAGNVVWARRAGSESYGEWGSGVTVDAGGNCYVVGQFSGAVDFGGVVLNSGSPSTEVFLVKYNSAGNVVWARKGGGGSADRGNAVTLDSAGNVYITGQFQLTATFGTTQVTSVGDNDVFLVKYDAAGNVLWARGGGGSNDDAGNGVAADSAGNSYITGTLLAPATFGGIPVSGGMFVVKYNTAGNVVWARGYGAQSGSALGIDAANSIYVAGFYEVTTMFGMIQLTNAGGRDVVLLKHDSAGNVVWARRAGGTGDDLGLDLAVDSAGNSYIGGRFQGTAMFANTQLVSLASAEVYGAKYDSGGNLLWAVQGGGSGFHSAYAIAKDAAGEVALGGDFGGTLTFGDTTLTGGSKSFVARLGRRPTMSVQRFGTNFVLRWPTNRTGFTLECTTNLRPVISWTVISPPYAVADSAYAVTNVIGPGSRYYRLRKP